MAEELEGIPSQMEPWGLSLEKPIPYLQGLHWALVDVKPATIEQHHEVILLDEDGNALNRPIFVMFGFPGGDGRNYTGRLKPNPNHWQGKPAELRGNCVYVPSTVGYAKHFTYEGGEDIWVWDVPYYGGALNNPSDIVKNCLWIDKSSDPLLFLHTGVCLTFQLMPFVGR